MKTNIFNRPWRASHQASSGPRVSGAALTAALLLLATVNLSAGIANGVVVGTVCGGGPSPYYGYVQGNPVNSTDAEFHTPIGLAQDSTGEYLYVADCTNNAIRVVDLFSSPDYYYFTYTFAPVTNVTPAGAISRPVGVALDANDNVYVLNRGNGNNGTVLKFDPNGNLLATNASGLANANAIALDAANNAYVSAGSTLIKIPPPPGVPTTVATISGAYLQGLVVMDSGLIAACDSGRNGIYLINPLNGVISTNTGFNGTGDNTNVWETTPNSPVTKATAKFNYPTGLAKAGNGMLIVADYGNNRVKVVDSLGTVTNLYGVSSNLWYKGAGAWPGWYDGNVTVPDAVGDVEARLPNGVLYAPNGTIYVTEDYYQLIRQVTGKLPPPPPPPAPTLTVSTNGEQITLTWSTAPGATSYNLYRSTSTNGPWAPIVSTPSTSYTDTSVLDGTTYYYEVSAIGVGGEGFKSYPPQSATLPVPPAPTILTVVTNTIGQVSVALTWSTSPGATSYNLQRSPASGGPYTFIANTSATSYTDTGVLSGNTYCYVVSAVGAGASSPNSVPWCVTLPLPVVPDPQIGYVTFPGPSNTSVFTAVSSFVANNDVFIAATCSPGTETLFTYGATPGSTLNPTNGSGAACYPGDGTSPGQMPATLVPPQPSVTVEAIGVAPGRPASAVVSAQFQFIAANPLITGDNAGQFTVSDITTNAEMWYTTDGSSPPNSATSVGPIGNGATLSLQFPAGATNLNFNVVAVRANYQTSAIVTKVFFATNFLANSISFGFTSGEASSEFIGSPGQTFYAPVTLSPLSGATIYSLQFNLTVTNVGPAPAVTPGAYFFESMLLKPDLNDPGYYITIPPAMFVTSATNPPPAATTNLNSTNVFQYNNGWFEPLTFIDSNGGLNLLGVGWLERRGKTNLYDTTSQTLIAYSQAHDTIFTPDTGKVILGGYAFQIPPNATNSQTYQIQIGRPSATSDGVGAPGSEVYIATPTNGSLAAGALNSIKIVTAGQRKYVVGDCAPFRWFNAGDFGDTNLDNSDVMQVFQSAIYGLNYPPPGSDFYDSMDSCGGFGVLDPSTGYLVNAGPLSPDEEYALFEGNDTLINQIAFGNSPQQPLDVCDVYVTFRRSLDPTLTWYRRFWTNGVLEAEAVAQTNLQSQVQAKAGSSGTPVQPKLSMSFVTNPPSVNFAAADFVASASQTLQVPITATIFGSYPLRVLMLNLSVEPLDGSPTLTSPVQFTPNAALGTPAVSSSTGNGNYSATWLNSAIAGLTGTATVGTLTVTVPSNASSSAAYAVHFDHASASPNGIASFPKQTLTGLITLSSRTSSYYNDGIPDSWRLRYFGTIYNVLSQASADADGDGANNWQEYIAGTDPTDPNSVLRASTDQAVAQTSQDCVIHWPSVAGKTYLIERSISLFGSNWTPVSTNTGSGTDMEFHDTSGGAVRFYRVHVTP